MRRAGGDSTGARAPRHGAFARRALGLALLLAAGAGLPAAAGTLAWVTNQLSDSVSLVALDGGETLAEIPVPGKPAGVALGPGGTVFVVSPDTATLSRIGPEGVGMEVTLPGGPFGVAVHPGGGAVYVGDWYGARIFEIDPGTGALRREIAVGDSPSGLALTPDGATLLSADRDSDAVSLIDTATGTVRASVPVGGRPFGITVGPGGRFAYTADVATDTVSVIDIAAGRMAGQLPVGARPYAVALTDTLGFVTNQYADSVTVFARDGLEPVAEIPVGEYPEGIGIGPDGRVVVANWGSDSISVIDPGTLAVVAEIPVGSGPRAFGTFLTDGP